MKTKIWVIASVLQTKEMLLLDPEKINGVSLLPCLLPNSLNNLKCQCKNSWKNYGVIGIMIKKVENGLTPKKVLTENF